MVEFGDLLHLPMRCREHLAGSAGLDTAELRMVANRHTLFVLLHSLR